MNKKNFENLTQNTYVYLDDLNNVIYQSDFTLVLGKVVEFRFIPKSNVSMEQGLTVKMLEAIANLIKNSASIGVKKAEAIKEE
jgi:hypothetical protein